MGEMERQPKIKVACEAVENKLSEQISSFSSKRKFHRGFYNGFRYGAALAALGAAVVLAFDVDRAKDIALGLSFGATLFTTLEALGKHGEIYIKYTGTMSALMGIQQKLRVEGASCSMKFVRGISREIEVVLGSVNDQWKELRNKSLDEIPESK